MLALNAQQQYAQPLSTPLAPSPWPESGNEESAFAAIGSDNVLGFILSALASRDPATFSHSRRVTEIAVLIAENMHLSAQQIRIIYEASLLHDIGKIGLPDTVLKKESGLNRSEMDSIRTHPLLGYRCLSRLPFCTEIASIVLCHHERWDGHGYPLGLRGEEIPFGSRIIAVADTFDAITSNRPYRHALSVEFGIDVILRQRSEQFEASVVDHFLNVSDSLPEHPPLPSTATIPATL